MPGNHRFSLRHDTSSDDKKKKSDGWWDQVSGAPPITVVSVIIDNDAVISKSTAGDQDPS